MIVIINYLSEESFVIALLVIWGLVLYLKYYHSGQDGNQ